MTDHRCNCGNPHVERIDPVDYMPGRCSFRAPDGVLCTAPATVHLLRSYPNERFELAACPIHHEFANTVGEPAGEHPYGALCSAPDGRWENSPDSSRSWCTRGATGAAWSGS